MSRPRRSTTAPTDARRRGIGMLARLALVAIVATVLVPFEQPPSYAIPVTLSETLTGLPVETADGTEAADAVRLRSRGVDTPIAFSAVGFRVPESVTALRLRTATSTQDPQDPQQEWTEWIEVGFLDELDGPDQGTLEARDSAPGRHSEPIWVSEATALQLEVEGGSPEDVEVTLLDTMRLNDGPVEQVRASSVGASADASDLEIISRAQWGADESVTRDSDVTDNVYQGIVHHTAHTTNSTVANSYSRDEVPGLMRAMHRYHTVSLGWKDIGYHLLVDRFGRIYEGRRGGITKGLVGAHAAGFNEGTFGVSVIGNFLDAEPSAAALDALADVIGFKSAVHGIDPTGMTDKVGDGALRPTIVGHRDVGRTSCPGRIQPHLPEIREQARETAVRFPDVEWTSPHREAILSLADAGVTYGCEPNRYCPDETLTRAQAASFMLRAFELEPIPGSRFSDVAEDGTHAEAINALAELGWILGYPDGTFRPGETLTRGQVASLVARTLPAPNPLDAPPWPYPDVATDHAHFEGVTRLAAYDIRGDCDNGGSFCPDQPVERDSTASFLHRVLEAHTGLEETPYGYDAPSVEEEEGSDDPQADGGSDDVSDDEGSEDPLADGGSDDPQADGGSDPEDD
ncbi:MAG: S-layer homology domain-containing protein [Nitriliruptoraceae bacterium]